MNVFHTASTDRWLTPPELVAALGPFDLDPCAEPRMPWRTAERMWSLAPTKESFEGPESSEIVDGLVEQWRGRVWCNPPYSAMLPWVGMMIAHGDGIMLTSGKAPDTQWCQRLLGSFDLALFLAGRLLFRLPDGSRSNGKWLPNVLWAFGERNAEALRRLHPEAWPGVLMTREER